MARRISSPVLVGRRSELERLRKALAEAASGRPSVVLVAGEAGVGKTRLVLAFADQARGAGARVLVGGCLELGEDGLPYAPFAEAVRSLLDDVGADEAARLLGRARTDIARLVPGLAPARAPATTAPAQATSAPTPAAAAPEDGPAARSRLFEGVLAVIDRLATDRPLTLVVEDLQWADGSTRDLVRFLARSLRRERVLIVVTFRSDDLHRRHPLLPLLADLDRLGTADRIDLARLGRDEVADQLAGILGRPAEAGLVGRLHARSDGNPFFVEELVAAGAEDADRPLSATIREIVTVRTSRLPERTRSALRIASVVGRRAEHGLIAALAGVDEGTLAGLLRPAVDEQVLIPIDDPEAPSYEFRHALVQEVLHDELLPAERVAIHAALAAMLEGDAGASTGRSRGWAEIAHHWQRAHELPRALAASVRAADEAVGAFAYAEALAQLERSLELWPAVPDAPDRTGTDRLTILERAADAAAAAGELTRAIALGDEALGLLGSNNLGRRLALSHRLAWYRWDHGDAAEAERTLREALAAGDDAGAGPRARLLSDLAHLHWSAMRYAEQRDAAAQALALSTAAGDGPEEVRARMWLGTAVASLGDAVEGLGHLERAMTGLGLDDEDLHSICALNITHILIMAGWNARGVEMGYREVERLRENGTFRRYGAQMLTNVVDPLLEMGRWDEAAALLDDPDWPREESRASAWMFEDIAELACRRGDLDAARGAMRAARELASPTDAVQDLMWLSRADSILAREEGRLEDASRLLWAVVELSADPVHDLPLSYWIVPSALSTEADLAETARARRDDASLERILERGRRLIAIIEGIASEATPTARGPQLTAFLAHGRAERSRLEGRSEADAWSLAAKAFAAVEEPFQVATALLREAEALLAAAGDRRRAGEALARARALAGELGAMPLVRAADELASRARLAIATPAADTPGLDSPARYRPRLSPREREVLALVARGWTNREIGGALFIAEKTASVHVTHILDKLGVSSRVEAALAASRAGFVAESTEQE